MKNKIIFLSLILLITLSCCSNNNVNSFVQSTPLSDTPLIKKDGSPIAYFDSLNVFAELQVTPNSLDSIIANVTIINESKESIWLYKPILPSDSLVEEAFYVSREDKNENLPHIFRETDHQYYMGDKDFLPSIVPIINDSNFLELLPGTKMLFVTNLSKHYDFMQLDRKAVTAIFINYSMNFPYVKNKKHVFLRLDENISAVRPAYINISLKRESKNGSIHINDRIKVILPEK